PLVAVAAVIGWASSAQAAFIIRATDVNSSNTVVASVQVTGASNADGSGSIMFNQTVGNFSITLVTDIASTGPNFTSASQTVNIEYNGLTGANSDRLIIEILGNNFANPTSGAPSVITSNASPSTSGLLASNVTMTSGVLSGNITALNSQSVG